MSILKSRYLNVNFQQTQNSFMTKHDFHIMSVYDIIMFTHWFIYHLGSIVRSIGSTSRATSWSKLDFVLGNLELLNIS